MADILTGKKVCFLADGHGLYDDRIYWKEALSLKKQGLDVHYYLTGEQDEEGITEEGIHFKKFRRTKNYHLSVLFREFFSIETGIIREVIRLSPDIIHIQDPYFTLFSGKMKKMSSHPKMIYDCHEPFDLNASDLIGQQGLKQYLIYRYEMKLHKWEYKSAGLFDYILCTDTFLTKRFREYTDEKKVHTIYNYTHWKEKRQEVKKEYDTVYAGTINRRRGILNILKAVVMLKEVYPEVNVLILGRAADKTLREEIDEYIRANGLEENIVRPGFVHYTELPEYLNKSRIALNLLDKVPAHENIVQIKLFEYMNFGLPIITSDFGEMKRYVEANRVGVAVDPEDTRAVSDALYRLLRDPAQYQFMSRNGIRAVDEKYDWKYMEEKLVALYKKLF